MTKTWRGPASEKFAMIATQRHARVRPAKRGEPVGAQVLSVRTCKGVVNASFSPLPGHHRHETIARAFAVDWQRPYPETRDVIGAALAMDDKTLSDLSTTLITVQTLCRKAECNCGAGYTPLIAGLVQDAPEPNAAFNDHLAIHGSASPEVATSPKIKAAVARMRLLQDIRTDLHQEAAR